MCIYLVENSCFKFSVFFLILISGIHIAIIASLQMLNTSNYIFQDRYINSTDIPYYSTIDPDMLPRTVKYGADYFFINSDLLSLAYPYIDMTALACMRSQGAYAILSLLTVVIGFLDVLKLLYKAYIYSRCVHYWYCMTPGKAVVFHSSSSIRASPSTTYTVLLYSSLYIVMYAIIRTILMSVIGKEGSIAEDDEYIQGARSIGSEPLRVSKRKKHASKKKRREKTYVFNHSPIFEMT